MINTQAIRETISAVLADVSKDDAKGAVKGSILLEARQFNQSPVNPNKCFDTLTKILHLIVTKGGVFTPKEESDLFFGVTKLFQSENPRLRRMVYLAIKTMNIGAGEAFIVTSSLTKDMNSGSDVHRANAIRVLSKIVDASMAMQIERYLKTAIVDKSAFVASSALVCGMNLLNTCPELVRRVAKVQFHALALLYELKKSDRLALHKVVGSLTVSPLKSPLAECLLIRYATRILRTEREAILEKSIVDYLEARLRHRSDIVVLEAARAICTLVGDGAVPSLSGTSQDLSPTLTALQIMLSSQRSVVRFAAIRTLNKLSHTRPQLVSQCNAEIEGLLSDSNRSVATLALTTLLKTGNESGVERLIKQITTLMPEISDSFRIEIIRAVDQLATTYPSKHHSLMAFLASQPREEGSFEFKKEVVSALARLVQTIPQAQETGLLHFCEFIEDCEFPSLCIKVLNLLGELGPRTSCPSKYIRFIYNRLILESAAVRAASADALTKIAYKCPTLRKDIGVLLESCLVDSDDEIRDRVRLYYKALTVEEKNEETNSLSTFKALSLNDILAVDTPVSVDAVMNYTKEWLETATEQEGARFASLDFSKLPSDEEYQRQEAAAQSASAAAKMATPQVVTATATHEDISEAGGVISELKTLCSTLCPELKIGTLDHSTQPVHLTEKEAEYPVVCVKHMLTTGVVVLEFQVTNTMADQTLAAVKIVPTSFDQHQWKIAASLSVETLPFDVPKSLYMILEQCSESKDSDIQRIRSSTFHLSMTFIVKEGDDDLGYEDVYVLEPLVLSVADYLAPHGLRQGQFKPQWTALGDTAECVAKLSLNYRSMEETVAGLIELLNLAPCDGTELVSCGKNAHDLLLFGTYLGGHPVACRCMIIMSAEHGCLLKAICRTKHKDLSEAVLSLFD